MLYLTIFILLFLCGFLDVSTIVKLGVRKICFWFFIILFILLAAIRWKTGTDWNTYISAFIVNYSIESFVNWNFEVGYATLSFLVKSVTSSYSVFLAVFALLCISIKAYVFQDKRYSEYFLVSLLIFYGYYIGDMFPIRQSLALSIVLVSGRYIIERRLILFLICVYCATLFHTSSFIFIAAYPIATVKLSTKMVAYILIISSLAGYYLISLGTIEWLAQIPGLSDRAQDKLDTYATMSAKGIDTSGGSAFISSKISFFTGLARKIVVLVPLLMFRKRLAEKYEFFPIFFNLIIFGAIFYFTLGSLMQVLKRGASYYDIFEILTIPMFIFLAKNAWQRSLIYIIIALYAASKLYLVIGYYKDLYIPYYTIFNNSIDRTMY